MIQSKLSQCFVRQQKQTATATSDRRSSTANRDMCPERDSNDVAAISSNDSSFKQKGLNRDEDAHSCLDSILSERSHLSLFQKMTKKSPSYIEMTLISSASTPTAANASLKDSTSQFNHLEGGGGGDDDEIVSKRSKLKIQWEETCLKWGFVVVRQLTYVQETFSDVASPKDNGSNRQSLESIDERDPNSLCHLSIVVNGQRALKEKDEIIVTNVIPNSPAYAAGMVEGDVIHAVYGMKDPTLSLLHGIMRDSTRFVLTVKRIESVFDRSVREKIGVAQGPNQFVPVQYSVDEERVSNRKSDAKSTNEVTVTKSMQGNDQENVGFPVDSDSNSVPDSDLDRELFGDGENDDIPMELDTTLDAVGGPSDALGAAECNPRSDKEDVLGYSTGEKGNNSSDVTGYDHAEEIQGASSSTESASMCSKRGKETDLLHINNKTEKSKTFNEHLSAENDANTHGNGTETCVSTSTDLLDLSKGSFHVLPKVEESAFDGSMDENPVQVCQMDKSDKKTVASNQCPSSESDSHKDEVLLANLIERSIESHERSRNILEPNAQKHKKKRKLSDVTMSSSSSGTIDVNTRKGRKDNQGNDKALNKKEKVKRKTSKLGSIIENDAEDRNNPDVNSKRMPSEDSICLSNEGKDRGTLASHDDIFMSNSIDEVGINKNVTSKSNHDSTETLPHKVASDNVTTFQGRHYSISSLDLSATEDENQSISIRASPLTIPRASPLTVSRQPSKVTVTSTSAKAGLGTVKSAKLKRLWPDSSVFSKRILKWGPPELVIENFKIRFKGSVRNINKSKLPVIPSSFRDASEMIKFMSPHILEEGLHSMHQEFVSNSDGNGLWTRDVFAMQLRHCTPVDPKPISNCNPSVRTYEFACSLESNNGLQPPCNLGEIFVVHSPAWKQKCCLGMIGSNDINATFLSDQMIENDDSFDLFKLWICVSSEYIEGTGWLCESDMPSKNPDGSFPTQNLHILNIGTGTDMMRQYEGLKSIASLKSNIKRAIYGDDVEGTEAGNVIEELPTEPLNKPSCLCSTVWDHLKETTNPYQLAAIEKVMSGKVKENFALLQGPPGTGKTSTTVALVSALLNGSAPISGAKTGGTRVQVGRALQSSNSGVVKQNSSVARRILVCAPSNQAVDELAWKIHTQAIGGSGKVGCFNMVRFGISPGEDRHDGRGRRSYQKASSFYGNERDNFLSAINLDKMVRDVASGKEIHDFRSSETNDNFKPNDKKRKSRYINFNVERQKILSHCHVVCTTLSGAGSKAFIESVSRDEYPQSEFDAVIIDEACQGSETSCLIPLKYNPNIVVLVGDPKQLPVMTFCPDASRYMADRSLFERLHGNGWPVSMLRIQYRMHPDIAKFPSRTFYNNNLINCDLVMNRRPAVWHGHLAFPPYLLWNIREGVMSRGPNGGISNNEEAMFVVTLLKRFSQKYPQVRNIEIGIISFYNDQVGKIKQKVNDRDLVRWMNNNSISIQVSTVDGFQGSEKDIIILSCVRSKWMGNSINNNIGFLKDFRRVNVALTRAKHSLWVIAHCEMLSRDPLWNELISDADKRSLIAQGFDLDRFMGVKNRKKNVRRYNK